MTFYEFKTLFDRHVAGPSRKDNGLCRHGLFIFPFTDNLASFLSSGILKQGLVVGEIAADQTGLCHVGTRRRDIKQNNVFQFRRLIAENLSD